MFYTLDPPNHVAFENEVNIRHQKNWIPFDFCPYCNFQRGLTVANSNATLLFIYSIRPHRIVQAFATNVSGEMKAETVFLTELLPEFRWRWGEMRGGSPALLMGDSYLSFFHSSGHLNHKHIGTYVMGAYIFDRWILHFTKTIKLKFTNLFHYQLQKPSFRNHAFKFRTYLPRKFYLRDVWMVWTTSCFPWASRSTTTLFMSHMARTIATDGFWSSIELDSWRVWSRSNLKF